jgi:acyl-CoA synthetase (AMP-forming)/AMP-acid ligase II
MTAGQKAPGTYPGMDPENLRPLDIDLAALVYTSGTTGTPKGVMCSHRSMISVAKSVIQYLDNRPGDRILNVLPLSFGYGLYQVIMATMFSGTVILERSFMYPSHILERIGQERVTGFPLVPTMAAMWLRIEDMSPYCFDTLRYITSAGAALPSSQTRRLQKLLPHVSIIPMYGLTECKRVTYLRPEDLDARPDSVGKAIPNCAVSLIDDQGKKVGPNQVGELVVRGANVMQGYWGDVELTSRVFRRSLSSHERSVHTGDYFRMDEEGFLYFLGRRDDMINCKGERISPREIENCICGLDAVAEAAVVGVPDEIFGQAIKAYVVIREGQSLQENEVLRICSQSLEAYMIPKFIEFAEKLPRTANGKVNKMQLRKSEVWVS